MSEQIDVSIIIPTYNEAKRLPAFLDRVISYCNKSEKRCEIIIVDDGSRDNTLGVIAPYKSKFSNLDIVRIRKNRGKGYAVKRGLLRARGEVSLFLDADGSVDPQEITKNIHYILRENYDIFIGSRVLRDKEHVVEAKWYRELMGGVFNWCVRTFLFRDIKDTQCGFKMFKKEIVKPLFSRSYLRGFGFDIEILYLARKMGYKIKEAPVFWRHVGGSKVNLVTDSIKMFFNILQVRNWHCTPINPYGKYMGPDEYKYMYEMEKYHWWFVSRKNLVINLIKSLKILSPVILDVGSGTGGNLLAFGELGESFGADISGEAIAYCEKRGINNVAQCPVEKMAYGDKTFDIITCLDLLEHVVNPVEALLEMKRVLRDRGKIIIMVPAFRALWSQHDEALCHLRRYNKSSLMHDLHEAGLEAENIGYFFFTSFFAVAAIRIMRKFMPPRLKAHSDTTTLPPKFLNEFLKFLFNLEIKLLNIFKLPLGTSIYAIASKE